MSKLVNPIVLAVFIRREDAERYATSCALVAVRGRYELVERKSPHTGNSTWAVMVDHVPVA